VAAPVGVDRLLAVGAQDEHRVLVGAVLEQRPGLELVVGCGTTT
jgi:hypothetical protein